jgi:hypothetical protein
MKLQLSALKVHLAHCAAIPRIGRYFGIAFTTSGIPAIVAVIHP